ncbi:MAG: ABC transporter permease [Dehalococcoidales bacterium]|nr:ABC transporter permease [Dehalococcoidales bacterium]
MNFLESFNMSVRSLLTNKLRSFLTMLGIIIGVGSVIALMSIGRGAQASILSTYDRLGTNMLVVVPSSGEASTGMAGFALTTPTLTLTDAEAIERAYGVTSISPTNESFVMVSTANEEKYAVIEGVTPAYLDVMNHTLDRGQFIAQHDVSVRAMTIVLGSETATSLFGDRDPIGQTVKMKGLRFTVIGVLEAVGGSMMGISMDNVVYVPITTFQTRLFPQRTATGEDSVQSISVRVTNTDVMPDTMDDIKSILRRQHRITADEKDDFSIITQDQVVDIINQVTGVFSIFLGAIASISLVVGGIGIMNIMLVSVTERTREVGIRKAVGAKRRDILVQFLLEAGVLSLIGGAFGVLGGWAVSFLVSQIPISGMTIQSLVTPDIVALALGVSLVIGLTSGIYPAMRAARLNPIDALHYQ